MIAVEVCVDTLAGLHVAAAAGVARIELCSALDLGGLTPSFGLMQAASQLAVPVHAMIRPRAGNFVFEQREIALMIADVKAARDAGLQGVVLGALDGVHGLDRDGLAAIIAHCSGLGLTLHRAVDLVSDQSCALEIAVDLGFDRILTSGGAPTALRGARRIAELVDQARGRISIMPGSGVTADNLAAIVAGTAVSEVHASCRSRSPEPDGEGVALGFGSSALRTDPELIAALMSASNHLSACLGGNS